ncbi:MAG TPA: S8 family serine peptidase, partial [Coriobacteriia bacterium]|nr:S8 family serine peptidase [Coriobacteriia bacterium]
MPDHLPLPGPIVLESRRRTSGHNPDQGPLEPDRHGHATTLAGVLAGLGLPYPGFDSQVPEEEPVDSRIVLVFEGRAALERGPFRKWQMTPLAETDGNSYLVLSDAESRRTFANLVAQYGGDPGEWDRPESWRSQLDAITGVRLYGREDRASSELAELSFAGAEVVDVLVWPSTLEDPRRRRKAAAARVAELENLVAAAAVGNAAVRVAAADPRPDTTMLRIVADEELLDLLLDHPLVERIHPPVRPRVSHADLAAVTGPSGPVVPSGEPIGVIDDLVHDNPYLVGAITARGSFPSGRTFSTPTGHGTQVAGIAAYGDLGSAVGPGAGLAAPLPIFGARIMEQDPGDPSRAIVVGSMHSQLEDALRWLHAQGVKVAVCSINADDPDDGALPTAATAMLDELARELDMVVVVSAGNRPDPVQAHWLRDYPSYL